MANPMLDKEFLKQLDQTPLKEVYAEIIALNDKDEILESIEGRVTQGTVNIDGASSVRRTCSLTIAAEELNIHEYYWGLHTRFKLALGVKNNINSKYPDIIWFKQGIFVISSFSSSQSTNSYTISIQGKDKMTRLNGEFGGMVTALTHDFGTVLETDEMGYTKENKIKLKDIIIGAVHQFANEPLHNIIVNDLDEVGLELLEYRGEEPIFLRYNETTTEAEDFAYGYQIYYLQDGTEVRLDDESKIIYNPLFELDNTVSLDYTKLYATPDASGDIYSIAKISFGMTAGYRVCDLVYAGDLILNIGETITAMLDKIVAMLGEYEYFYDIDGRFIFQRKKTYMVNSWNNIHNAEDEIYADNIAHTSAISYSFEDGNLITSYSNNPNYPNIKNDFSVWGTRKSTTGQELPIHMRYAIDEKPWLYVSYNGIYYTTEDKDTLAQRIRDEYGEELLTYKKKPNPRGLSEDWWDIFDWAEYYKKCTGDYPNEVMGQYLRNGGVQFTAEEMYAMFPKGEKTTTTFIRKPIYIFDVEADGTLGNTGHGTSCTAHHYKDYFVDGLQARGATAYMYKPDLPTDLKDFSDILEPKTSLDWREVIYQMALDWENNHLKDDFALKIETNNFYHYRKGITGYEQYYVDLLGFWRELYDPDYIFHFENVMVNRQDYEQAINNWENDMDKEFPYYYSKPLYKQCTKDMPYSASAIYYAYVKDEQRDVEIMKEVSISALDYTGNEMKYYYISADEPTEIVNAIILEPHLISEEPYYDKDKNKKEQKIPKEKYYSFVRCAPSSIYNPFESYYKLSGNKYNKVNINEETFNNSKTSYYYLSLTTPTETSQNLFQIKSYKYLPCFEIIPYGANKEYYDDKGNLKENVSETNYHEEPAKYYLKNYIYFQCNDNMEFIPGKKYYVENSTNITDEAQFSESKIISKESYDKNRDKYYIRLSEIVSTKNEEVFNTAETYYYMLTKEASISEEIYKENPLLYYVLKNGVLQQCANEPYDANPNTKYYTIELESRVPITRREFESNKEKYYLEDDFTYILGNQFDENEIYYSREFKPLLVAQKPFDDGKKKGRYYTKEINSYTNCKIDENTVEPYDASRVYYLHLLSKDSNLSQEIFEATTNTKSPSEPIEAGKIQYYKAEQGYIQCSVGTVFNKNTIYYKRQGNFKSCAAFKMSYDQSEKYYIGNKPGIPTTAPIPAEARGGGGGSGGNLDPTYTLVTIDEAYFNNPRTKPYIYVKRPLYQSCQDILKFNEELIYYKRKPKSSSTPGGSNRPNSGGGGSGGGSQDDNHHLFEYTPSVEPATGYNKERIYFRFDVVEQKYVLVGKVKEQEYNDNYYQSTVTESNYSTEKFSIFIEVDNYNPQTGLDRIQFKKEPTSYYTYTTICHPCGYLEQCVEEDVYKENLTYYNKDDKGQMKVILINNDTDFNKYKKELYYGLPNQGISYTPGLTYYKLLNGVYQKVSNLSKTDFEKDISKYYYKYCSPVLPDDLFASDVEYYSYKYIKQDEVKQENYDGFESKYWYVKEENMVYQMCTESTQHETGKTYYVLEYTPIYDLTREQFDSTKHYIRNAESYRQCGDKYIQCTSASEYKASEIYYNKNEDGTYKIVSVDKDSFKGHETNYYTKEVDYFSSANLYYVKLGETYIPKSYLDEKEFLKMKDSYCIVHDIGTLYRCVRQIRDYITDGTYAKIKYGTKYQQCTLNTPYNPNEIYYTFDENKNEYIKVEGLSKEEYEDFETKYYIIVEDKSKKEYEIFTVKNEEDYKAEILNANIYLKQDIFERCLHPIEYSPSVYFYVKKDDKYIDNWHKNIYENPELLNFWFDFMSGDSELQKFGCHAIGNRPKGVNDNQVKAIYFREAPTIIFVNSKDWDVADKTKLGYTYIQLPPEFEVLFDISSQGKSAKTAVDNLVYQHACGAEQISISVLPIYHLEPNTRIFVRNDESGINGEYILVRYNLTLGTNGTMSITAAKAVDKLY